MFVPKHWPGVGAAMPSKTHSQFAANGIGSIQRNETDFAGN
jgi:hypothetical protein